MTNQELELLAYRERKSPKTRRRTRFQDELQAAVSARASKMMMMDQYSNDFDDEDDFLKELLKSRKSKVDAFKASKAKMVNFELSDDEEDKPAKSKRVSFLKTQSSGSPLGESGTDSPFSRSIHGSVDNSSFSSKHITSTDLSTEKRSDEESSNSHENQESTQRSLTPVSEGALENTPPSLPSDTHEDTPDSLTLQMNETQLSAQSTEKTMPTPKPRQRVMAVTNRPQDKRPISPDQNMPFALKSDSSKQYSSSSNLSDGKPDAGSRSRTQSLSSTGEHSILTKSTMDSVSKNGFHAEDSGDYSLSFEELSINQTPATMQESMEQMDCLNNSNGQIADNLCDTRSSAPYPKGSLKAFDGSVKSVESKYLGSLSVLDRPVSLQDPEPQADYLRAAVYQTWLKKKKEHLKQSAEIKKKEEIAKEKKKKDQEVKKEDAIASYEAWKEKKCQSVKMKIKEQQENTRKAERAKEEREEKRQAAKQVFEKWKHERDLLLKERCRKARLNETEQKLQKQEKEEERKKSSHSAFLEWSEKKRTILQEKASSKRKELRDLAKTEHYLKEEKDKMAVDMYESWLERKNQEKKRHKEEKWLQGIMYDSPPPPWSPPNKTVPRGK